MNFINEAMDQVKKKSLIMVLWKKDTKLLIIYIVNSLLLQVDSIYLFHNCLNYVIIS